MEKDFSPIEDIFQKEYNKIIEQKKQEEKEIAEKNKIYKDFTSQQADLFIEKFSFLKKYGFSFSKLFEYEFCSQYNESHDAFYVMVLRYNNYSFNVHFPMNIIKDNTTCCDLTTYPFHFDDKCNFTFEMFSCTLAKYIANNKL